VGWEISVELDFLDVYKGVFFFAILNALIRTTVIPWDADVVELIGRLRR